MAQLLSVTCLMGSHSVTCYPTQVNSPRLNPSHTGRYSIYLPRRDGRLSWPSWLDSVLARSRTSNLSIMSPTLNQCNHQDKLATSASCCVCTTKPTSKYKTKNLVSAVQFSNKWLWRFGDSFSHYLIHNSSFNMMVSTVKVFFLHAVSLHF